MTEGVTVPLPQPITEVLVEATGRGLDNEPTDRRTGSVAGNSRLTAWTGIAILTLVVIQLCTLLDLDGLLLWHILVGCLLVPFALLKTGTTTWRMARYYRGAPAYRLAGRPPLLLRVLGPLVVLSFLALLGTGLTVAITGPVTSTDLLFTAAGQRVDLVTVHAAVAVAFSVFAGLHVLARIGPAVKITTGYVSRVVAGRPWRATALIGTVVAGLVVATLVLDHTMWVRA